MGLLAGLLKEIETEADEPTQATSLTALRQEIESQAPQQPIQQQPFQPKTKQDFLSEQGVDFLLQNNPELAAQIASKEQPSRREIQRMLGLTLTTSERTELSARLRGEQQAQSGVIKLLTDPIKTLGQAFAQSVAGKPAAALRGATVFTPGEGLGVDKLLNNVADFLESLRNPETKVEIQKKTEGRLFPVQQGDRWFQIDPKLIPEVINTWAANVGDQIPLMLMTLTGRAIGAAVGKPVGATAGLAAGFVTAGPDPTDAVTVPAVAATTAKVVEHLGGAIPLIGVEAAGFMDRAEQTGIDKDIAEQFARPYSLASGLVEYAQVLWNLKAFKRLTGPAKKTILKKIMTELGGAAFEGLEEVTQGGLENFFLGKAIAEQKNRDPSFTAQKPEIFEGAKRQFVIGAGISLITRGAGKGTRLLLDIDADAQSEVDTVTEDVIAANTAEDIQPPTEPTPAVEPEIEPEPVVEAPTEAVAAEPPTEGEVPQVLVREARKHKTGESFADKLENANVGEFVKSVPVSEIEQSEFYKSELAKAQKEISEGTARPISKDPVRLFFQAEKNNFSLIDGFHRLATILNQGKKSIKASIETTANREQLVGVFEQSQPTPTAKPEVTEKVVETPDSAQVPREDVAEFVVEKPPVTVKEDGKPIPVPVETEEFIATGERRQRGFSKSLEAEAVTAGMVEFFEDIPEFNQLNFEEHGKLNSDLLKNDPEKADRVAMGQEAAPKGHVPELIMVSVANKALADGDSEKVRDIALNSKLAAEATKMGQRIRALGELGDLSPVKAMKAVVASREDAFNRRKSQGRKVDKNRVAENKKADVAIIKESIAKAKPKNGQQLLDDFITSLQC